MRYGIATWVVAAVLATSAPQAGSTWTLDPRASSITFTLKATLHEVEGSFELVSGEIRFDPRTGAVLGRVVVDARSGDTANGKRDKKMHESVLHSTEHPIIEFVPTSFEGALEPHGKSDLRLHGTLRLMGVEHAVELPLELHLEPGEARARGSFSVPYVEWGLEDPSAFVLRVAKVVQVSFEVVGRVVADPEK